MKPSKYMWLIIFGLAAFGGWRYAMGGNSRIQARLNQEAADRTKQKEADAQWTAQLARNTLVTAQEKVFHI